MKRIVWLAVFVLIAQVCFAKAEPRQIKIDFLQEAPQVDGKINDLAWKSVSPQGSFVRLGRGAEKPHVNTYVRAGIYRDILYIAFTCIEPRMQDIKTSATSDGRRIYGDDLVEVFFQPVLASKHFFHLAVNAAGFRHAETTAPTRLLKSWYEKSASVIDWYPDWQSAVHKGKGEWTVEISIPLSKIGVYEAGQEIGINFCRGRQVRGEVENITWSRIPDRTFHAPKFFGRAIFPSGIGIDKNIQESCLPEKCPSVSKIVRAPGQSPDKIEVLSVQDEPAATLPPLLIPSPQHVRWPADKYFLIEPNKPLRLAVSAGGEAALFRLIEDLESMQFPFRKDTLPAGEEWFTLELGQTQNISMDPPPSHPQGYRLKSDSQGVRISARTVRGLHYGTLTLIQLMKPFRGYLKIIQSEIENWPTLPIRAITVNWPRKDKGHADDNIKYLRELRALADLRYNMILLPVGHYLQSQIHPHIGAGGYPFERAGFLLDKMRKRQMEPVPLAAIWSQSWWLIQHYPEFAENPGALIPHMWFKNLCPRNEEAYDLIFEILEEQIELFQARYLHIGHDEIHFDEVGTCPRCRGTSAADLLVEGVIKIHEFLSERNIQTFMWADMLDPEQNGGFPLNMAEALARLPRDIILCDWKYTGEKDRTSLARFEEYGFKTIVCSWYDIKGVMANIRSALKWNAEGYMATTWGAVTSPENAQAIVLGADLSWNPHTLELSQIPYLPSLHFFRDHPLPVQEGNFSLLPLGRYSNASFLDSFRLGPAHDLSNLPSGILWARGVPFRVRGLAKDKGNDFIILRSQNARFASKRYPLSVNIPMNIKADKIFLLHTASNVPTPKGMHGSREFKKSIGSYQINFQGGGKHRVDLIFRENINSWNQIPVPDNIPAWTGKTAGGDFININYLMIENPRPGVAIKSIQIESDHTEFSPMILAITGFRVASP